MQAGQVGRQFCPNVIPATVPGLFRQTKAPNVDQKDKGEITMKLLLRALLPLALLFSTALSAAMYKWVDENGQTHYSQYPPPAQDYEALQPPPPPASDAGQAQQRLEQLLQRQEEQRQGREQAEQEAAAAEQQAEQRRKACAAARHNLEILTTGGRKRITGPDGVARYLPEEERQAKIAEARQQIEEYCN